MYEQKDIVLVYFPFTDLRSGKVRPVLIISNKKLNRTEDRICMQITSKENIGGLELKPEVLDNKLVARSWIKPDKVFTLNKKIIKKKISKVNNEFHKKAIKELTNYLL